MLEPHKAHSLRVISTLSCSLLLPFPVEASRSGHDTEGGKEGQDISSLLVTYCSALLFRQRSRAHHRLQDGMEGNDLWSS
jgi:hypothetical protein